MTKRFSPLLLGLGLVAGIAFAAQAQTASTAPAPRTSIANLPLEGPRTNSMISIPNPREVGPVVPSGEYPGPRPGASQGQMPPRFEKPADWDSNMAYHPYDKGFSPSPH
jgi:hypothetical protein